MSDLPYTLRQGVLALSDVEHSYAWIRDALREAADALEGYEQALLDIAGWENWQTPTWREIARNALPGHVESELLEREAVLPEVDLGPDLASFTGEDDAAGDFKPLFPIESEYPGRAAYRDAVVAWVRAVTAIDRSKP